MATELINTIEPRKIPPVRNFTFICMVIVAIILDLLSTIPVLNEITIILADVIFIPWTHIAGMKFNSRRFASFAAMTGIELIPGISTLPTITLNLFISRYYLN